MSIIINDKIRLGEKEVELSAIRAQGPGGQHVNKVSTAIHLRFDIRASSLPETYKQRLLAASDSRITSEGVIIIKTQQFRSQIQNRNHAISHLVALIRRVNTPVKKRRPTRPKKAAREKRLNTKNIRSKIKKMRQRVLA